MTQVHWRAATSADVAAVTAVVNASERHDRRPEVTPPEEVRNDVVDPEIEAVVGEVAGRLVAYGLVIRPEEPGRDLHAATLLTYVAPEARDLVGDGLVQRLAAVGEEHLAAQTHGLPTVLHASAMEWQDDDLARLERLGFRRSRVTTTMSIDLAGGAPTVPQVEGVRIGPWDAAASEVCRRVHNAAFRDHFASSPMTEQAWRSRTVDNGHFRADLSCLALTDDALVGYLLAHRYAEDDEVSGRREAWISTLGVEPAWRRRGVAAALLARTLQRAADDPQITHAGLDVDAESLTGADRLYERLGFTPVARSITMARPVPPLRPVRPPADP